VGGTLAPASRRHAVIDSIATFTVDARVEN
jgi:hypothetical protein